MSRQNFEYDVALSFAGEDRAYVEEVANHLRARGVRCFYDRQEEVTLWGKDLYVHLDEVYRTKARFCVIFISKHYAQKLWTSHERESAQARAFAEHEEYILPARFDDTEIPGIRPTTGYISLGHYSPDTFADLICKKIGRCDADGTGPSQVAGRQERDFRKPRAGNRTFNPYSAAQELITLIGTEIERRCRELSEDGVSVAVFDRQGMKCVRVVLDGTTRYSLNLQMGGMAGDASLGFYGVQGETSDGPGTLNAWGHVIWSKERDKPILAFNDMSLLSFVGQDQEYEFEEFVDALWEKICNALENN